MMCYIPGAGDRLLRPLFRIDAPRHRRGASMRKHAPALGKAGAMHIYWASRREGGLPVPAPEEIAEGRQRLPAILLMRTEHAGEALLTVKRYPRELAAVVFEEAGGETDAPPRRHVGQSGVVLGAVEIVGLPAGDQPVLHRLQGGAVPCSTATAAPSPAQPQ